MDEVANQNLSLQQEVDRLTALLQLSERKRLNQKIVYDKNLENLHEKLADFENILLKEQKDVQVLFQKKDQQLKVREDLASTLQSRLDNRYCSQCGYPTWKNKFDTDWEIDISEEKPKIQKLPPLSLPTPDSLPLVTFSNRQCHFKSKLSPVTEECEVAASSYLRNIHADQTPDRFHAVLTASLECLQVVDYAKKNITPESERPEEILGFPSTLASDNFNDSLQENLIQPRKLDLEEDVEEVGAGYASYHCPRPSVQDCSLDDIEKEVQKLSEENISDYANGIAISILEAVYYNFRKNDIKCKTVNDLPSTCIQSYSNNLAFGILSTMETDIRSSTSSLLSICKLSCDNDGVDNSELLPGIENDSCSDRIRDTEHNSNTTSVNTIVHESHSTKRTSGDSEQCLENEVCDEKLSNHMCNDITVSTYDDNVVLTNGETDAHSLLENGTEKVCDSINTSLLPSDPNSPKYSRVSTMVVPLVDQAMKVAKTIVRRRSSTNFMTIDSSVEPEDDDGVSEEPMDICNESQENLSFNRKTLIELIDQAVENVIPTVNGCKDKLLNSALQNGQDAHLESHNNINGAIFDFNDDDPNFIVDNEPLPDPVVPGTGNNVENKENDFTRSKKRKSKKKKKKKKGAVGDPGSRIPETVDHIQTASVNLKENRDISMKMDYNLGCSFDPSHAMSSSLNNSATEISTTGSMLNTEEDKFSLAVDQSFNEMEASRGSTPDTLDGFQ